MPSLPFKPRSRFFRTVVLLAGTLLFSSACSIDPEDIAPDTLAAPSAMIPHGIRVMNVTSDTSDESCFGCAPKLERNQFREALVITLRKSGLFTDVGTDRGDINLFATIRSQSQDGMFPTTATTLVTYRFADQGGKTIWQASFESKGSSNAFGGVDRANHALEASAKANLASLLDGIRRQWPKGM